MNIKEFKKDDVVTRVDPRVEVLDDFKDFSLVGKKVIFLGIANASIYLQKENDVLSTFNAIFGDGKATNTLQIPLELWEEGWAKYEDPDFLKKDENPNHLFKINSVTENDLSLQELYDKAVEVEDFELAQKLRLKMEEEQNGKNGSK